MSWCKGLSDDAFKEILRRSENLKSIDVSLCGRVSSPVFSELGKCTKIQALLASKCHQLMDPPIVEAVRSLRELSVVNFSECAITDLSVEEMARMCNKLRVILLAGCKSLTSKSLEALSRNCPNIEMLNVSGSSVDDQGVRAIVTRCGGIFSLTLSSCKAITDDALEDIATHTRVLQQLYVSYCSKITERGLTHIAKKCNYLQVIEFATCPMKDEILCDLVVNATLLQAINANGCVNLTDRIVDYLWVYGRHLTTLDVSRCTHLTTGALEGLFKLMPALNIYSTK